MKTIADVIKGFEVCLSGGISQRCVDCPYHKGECSRGLEEDALALLKEREPVKPVRTVNDHGFHYDYCGNCERLLPVDPKNRKANFCPCCGKPVNWSDYAPEEKTEIANDYTVQIAPRQIPLKW